MLLQHQIHGLAELLHRGAPAAAQPQVQHRRHQQQGVGKGLFPQVGDADADLSAVLFHHARRQLRPDGEPAHQGHGMLQNGGRHCLGFGHVCDGQALPRRPGVHRELSVDVGGGGNDRGSVQHFCQFACQFIGAADMAGQQRDHKMSQLVHGDNGGVGALIFYKGRDLPHGDAGGAHEHHGVSPLEHRAVKGPAGTFDGRETRLLKARHGIGPHFSFRQGRHDPAGRFTALAAVGEHGGLHLLAFRNSVENSGAYRRERVYCSPMQPPTMMRDVLVRPFSVTVLCRVSTVQRKIFSSGQVAL